MHVYPIRLVPRVCARVWGGHRLEGRFGRSLPMPAPAGESWEVHGDLPVANGPYRGRTLDELALQEGPALLGRSCPPGSRFPLLVKWLDCEDWLSVQVHPDDETARRLTGDPSARGKTECWYIAEAAPGAEVLHGLAEGATPEDLARARGSGLLGHLRRLRPRTGEVLFTPAGTVHALGPGLLILEIQQSCDLTYRLYDWDRPGLDGRPRPLHEAEALEVIRSVRPEPEARQPGGLVGEPRISCSHFSLESLSSPATWSPRGESMEILALVGGEGRVRADEEAERLSPGDVVVLPAATRRVQLELDPGALVLRARVPEGAAVPA